MKILGEGNGWRSWEDDEDRTWGEVWPVWEGTAEKQNNISQEERDAIWEEAVESVMEAFSRAWEALAKC